jgi:hypothetical protein
MTGTVVETMDASNYTYVRIKSRTAEVWVAAAQFKVALGDHLTVPLENPMEDFESKSLKRTFPLIYFVSRVSREGEALSAATPSQPSVKVDMAPGGMRVGDVWARRQALSGKSITVRGTVVKFNGGILGRNWIHIQDGTGSSKEGTDDLTVTSDAVATVGTVVTITGNLALDKDFGAGYAYPVIVESAAITPN